MGKTVFKRKIYHEILEWKEKKSNKYALLIKGARRVGKSTIVQEFAKNEFKSYILIDFAHTSREIIELFDDTYNLDFFFLKLQQLTGTRLYENESVIIFDEVQLLPKARQAIKYLVADGRYKYIETGSLLSIKKNTKDILIPSEEHKISMYPMDFEEFLMAAGETDLCDLLHQPDWEILKILSLKYIDLLRQYYYVGGMPEVVDCFFQHQNLQEVRDKQTEILDAYRWDISKHTTPTESMRIGQVLQSLPSQLAKENKKFIYNILKKGARATEYELAIQWLMDAGLVHKVSRVKELQMPVRFYEDLSAFKLFLLDCGLLGCMTEAPASQMLVGDNVFKEFKGAFTEQFVLQQLVAQGFSPYYWSNDKTPAKIDFVVQTEHRVIPVEVKAEENVRARSMSEYIKNHPDYQLKGLRISMMGYQDQNWMENTPLFAITKFFG